MPNVSAASIIQPRKRSRLSFRVVSQAAPIPDSKHGGSTGLAADIDNACQSASLWPDVVLSGHAHLYQRFTRAVDSREIPYVVAGSGGFAATPPKASIPAKV